MTAIDKIARYFLLTALWIISFVIASAGVYAGAYAEIAGIALFILSGLASNQAPWHPTSLLDKLARYGFLGGLWLSTCVYIIYVIARIEVINLTMLCALGVVLATSVNLFPRSKDTTQPSAALEAPTQPDEKAKRKNDQTSGLSPLDILTPEDLYDLREDIKAELRARILSGADGELSSLDALLAGQDSGRKTAKK